MPVRPPASSEKWTRVGGIPCSASHAGHDDEHHSLEGAHRELRQGRQQQQQPNGGGHQEQARPHPLRHGDECTGHDRDRADDVRDDRLRRDATQPCGEDHRGEEPCDQPGGPAVGERIDERRCADDGADEEEQLLDRTVAPPPEHPVLDGDHARTGGDDERSPVDVQDVDHEDSGEQRRGGRRQCPEEPSQPRQSGVDVLVNERAGSDEGECRHEAECQTHRRRQVRPVVGDQERQPREREHAPEVAERFCEQGDPPWWAGSPYAATGCGSRGDHALMVENGQRLICRQQAIGDPAVEHLGESCRRTGASCSDRNVGRGKSRRYRGLVAGGTPHCEDDRRDDSGEHEWTKEDHGGLPSMDLSSASASDLDADRAESHSCRSIAFRAVPPDRGRSATTQASGPHCCPPRLTLRTLPPWTALAGPIASVPNRSLISSNAASLAPCTGTFTAASSSVSW